MTIRFYLLLALFVFTAFSVSAESEGLDPVATTKALRILLAESNTPIPRKSSCYGNYGAAGKQTVKDLLSMRLAYLQGGDNIISGKCERHRCAVSFSHAHGEDVSSTTVSFSQAGSKVKIHSLQCVMTP